MGIFDVHIHSEPENIDPKQLLARMASVGVDGGVIFSPFPESPLETGYSYEVRMDALDAFTKDYPGKLFPALFIHPMEKDAIDKAQDAVARGVVAFKMVCDCYYVSDEPAMALIREIAKLEKPILFHSGILWNGYDSSKYNRPLCFESLLNVPGLRFSLAHCSYPWYDECIALYGKFLNAYASNPDVSAEMFIDLTPGTPIIYRHDLINKVLNSGYDTPHNLLFGTDCTANDYNTKWAESWIRRDPSLMAQVGAGQRVIDHYLGENFMRFLGLRDKDFQHVIPVPDRADAWSLEYANATIK